MVRTKNPKNTQERRNTMDPQSPANTLLLNWAKRLSDGEGKIVPVFLNGTWSYQVVRGNKRRLCVSI